MPRQTRVARTAAAGGGAVLASVRVARPDRRAASASGSARARRRAIRGASGCPASRRRRCRRAPPDSDGERPMILRRSDTVLCIRSLVIRDPRGYARVIQEGEHVRRGDPIAATRSPENTARTSRGAIGGSCDRAADASPQGRRGSGRSRGAPASVATHKQCCKWYVPPVLLPRTPLEVVK
jgi:hypothetical protein